MCAVASPKSIYWDETISRPIACGSRRRMSCFLKDVWEDVVLGGYISRSRTTHQVVNKCLPTWCALRRIYALYYPWTSWTLRIGFAVVSFPPCGLLVHRCDYRECVRSLRFRGRWASWTGVNYVRTFRTLTRAYTCLLLHATATVWAHLRVESEGEWGLFTLFPQFWTEWIEKASK